MIILMTFVKISMQLGAAPIPSDVPVPSVEDLADQVADVLDFFGLGSVMCLGVTAGAYVLTLFAVSVPVHCEFRRKSYS